MNPATILIAEDEAPVRRLLEALLSLRYQLLLASDGREAIEIAANYKGQIDLLLTDIIMPGSNGIEVAAAIRRERPNIRVLFISGYDQGLFLRDSESSWEFLEKPFLPEKLLDAVSSILQSS